MNSDEFELLDPDELTPEQTALIDQRTAAIEHWVTHALIEVKAHRQVHKTCRLSICVGADLEERVLDLIENKHSGTTQWLILHLLSTIAGACFFLSPEDALEHNVGLNGTHATPPEKIIELLQAGVLNPDPAMLRDKP